MITRDLDYEAAADLLDALSNPARLHAMLMLDQSEMSVNVISESLGISQSAASQASKKLRTQI